MLALIRVPFEAKRAFVLMIGYDSPVENVGAKGDQSR